jgi:hypothetical protein
MLEARRILNEWQTRFRRVRDIIAPAAWSRTDWELFAVSVAILVQRNGAHWESEDRRYWDLRWNVRDGGELVCQVECEPQRYIQLVVAQEGGWAGDGSYTWMLAEFSPSGDFLCDPYWVDGSWKDALVALLIPYSERAGFYLGDRSETPAHLLLGGGAPSGDSTPPV